MSTSTPSVPASASVQVSPRPHAFGNPIPGSFEHLAALSAVITTLEDLAAALADNATALALIQARLVAAQDSFEAAVDANMAGFPC